MTQKGTNNMTTEPWTTWLERIEALGPMPSDRDLIAAAENLPEDSEDTGEDPYARWREYR
jgi:hypothetical protein